MLFSKKIYILLQLITSNAININKEGGHENLTPLELAVRENNKLAIELILKNKNVIINREILINLISKYHSYTALKVILEQKIISVMDCYELISESSTINDLDKSKVIGILFEKMSPENRNKVLIIALRLAITAKDESTIDQLLVYTNEENISKEICDEFIIKAKESKLVTVINTLKKLHQVKKPEIQPTPIPSEQKTLSFPSFFTPEPTSSGERGYRYTANMLGKGKADEFKNENRAKKRIKKKKDSQKPKEAEIKQSQPGIWFDGLLKSTDPRMRCIENKNMQNNVFFIPEVVYESMPKDFVKERLTFSRPERNVGLKLLDKDIIPLQTVIIQIQGQEFKIEKKDTVFYEYVTKESTDRLLLIRVSNSGSEVMGGALYLGVKYVPGGFHDKKPQIGETIVISIEPTEEPEEPEENRSITLR